MHVRTTTPRSNFIEVYIFIGSRTKTLSGPATVPTHVLVRSFALILTEIVLDLQNFCSLEEYQHFPKFITILLDISLRYYSSHFYNYSTGLAI